MTTAGTRGDGSRPTLGIDAVSLRQFVDVETGAGDLLTYDRDDEDAWVQSDLRVPRAAMV